jgi:hypothetical protein
MVDMIENEAQISARLVSRGPHPTNPDFEVLGVELLHADDVEGMPNLLLHLVGTHLDVLARRTQLPANAPVGSTLSARAERTREGAALLAEQAPGDLRIEQPAPEQKARTKRKGQRDST